VVGNSVGDAEGVMVGRAVGVLFVGIRVGEIVGKAVGRVLVTLQPQNETVLTLT